jgi:hypothetical protein
MQVRFVWRPKMDAGRKERGRNQAAHHRRNRNCAKPIRHLKQRIAEVAAASWTRSLYLQLVSKPAHDRKLYRYVVRMRARRIVEIGIGDGQRAVRLISLGQRFHEPGEVRYTGIDLFEARPASNSPLTLKEAHRLLQRTGAEVRLIPGEPAAALARSANELRGTDLVIVSADQRADGLMAAWHFLPRMLHKDSQVWLERRVGDGTSGTYEVLSAAETRHRHPSLQRTTAA